MKKWIKGFENEQIHDGKEVICNMNWRNEDNDKNINLIIKCVNNHDKLLNTCERLLKTIEENRDDLNNMPIEFVEGWLLQAINSAK